VESEVGVRVREEGSEVRGQGSGKRSGSRKERGQGSGKKGSEVRDQGLGRVACGQLVVRINLLPSPLLPNLGSATFNSTKLTKPPEVRALSLQSREETTRAVLTTCKYSQYSLCDEINE